MHTALIFHILILQMRYVLFLIEYKVCKNGKMGKMMSTDPGKGIPFFRIIKVSKLQRTGHRSTPSWRRKELACLSALQEAADLPPGQNLITSHPHCFALTWIGAQLCRPLDLNLSRNLVLQSQLSWLNQVKLIPTR